MIRQGTLELCHHTPHKYSYIAYLQSKKKHILTCLQFLACCINSCLIRLRLNLECICAINVCSEDLAGKLITVMESAELNATESTTNVLFSIFTIVIFLIKSHKAALSNP